jgi:hypothetical protein
MTIKCSAHLALNVPVLLAILCASRPVRGAGECADNPEVCAGPRSWVLDFDADLDFDSDGLGIGATEGWQRRNGTSPLPTVADGKATFDGTVAAWTLIDTMDHFFEGETTIRIRMDANPGTATDRGAGWWVNVDNNAMQGGFYAIYGQLSRTEDGSQEYQFGPDGSASERVPVAEGPIEALVTLTPVADDEELIVTYAVTDVDETHSGEFSITGRSGAGVPTGDKWFTLYSSGPGQGIIDHVEVYNQVPPPAEGLPGDFNGDEQVDQSDYAILVENFNTRSTYPDSLALGDMNLDGRINLADFTLFRDVFPTPGAAAVPEPAGLPLLFLGLLVFGWIRSWR